MAHNQELGGWGETLVARQLSASGMRIMERNWRCRYGEIDIVARDGDTVVLVEVKTRSSFRQGHPFEAVSPSKRATLRRLADAWRSSHEAIVNRLRIDAVSVYAPPGGSIRVEHLRGIESWA